MGKSKWKKKAKAYRARLIATKQIVADTQTRLEQDVAKANSATGATAAINRELQNRLIAVQDDLSIQRDLVAKIEQRWCRAQRLLEKSERCLVFLQNNDEHPEFPAPRDIPIGMLIKEAADIAAEKGFHDEEITNRTVLASKLALIHSEVSEALEEIRAGKPLTENWQHFPEKPEGVPAELADVVIRVFDLAGWLGMDLPAAISEKMHFNGTRDHKHGKAF